MTEVLFYHLERQPLEKVLPLLLDKTLQRGWRAVVRSGLPQRLRHLSDAIWAWRDESFIPHAMSGEEHAALQPVWLTADEENPNHANVLFCIDGAAPRRADLERMERVIVMFPASDPSAVEAARSLWRKLAGNEDLDMTYWRQNASGQWEKKA